MGGISDALGGFNRGFGQGMDLYSQFHAIQKEGEKERKTAEAEAFIQQLGQSGAFKTDKAGSMEQIRDFYLKQGDSATALQYDQLATGYKKVQEDRAAKDAYQLLQVNPKAAIPAINQWNNIRGSKDSFALNSLSGGRYEVKSNIDGADSTEVAENEEQLKMALGKYVMLSMMDAKDFATLQLQEAETASKVAENRAQTAASEQATAESKALLPGRIAGQAADIAQSKAAAGASAASAEYSRGRTAMLPVEQRAAEAEAGLKETQAQLAKEGAPAALELAQAQAKQAERVSEGDIDVADIPKAWGVMNPSDLLPNQSIPPTRRPEVGIHLTLAMKKANGYTTNAEAAAEAANVRDMVERTGGNLHYDPATGELFMPDGTTKKVPMDAWQMLTRGTAPPPE